MGQISQARVGLGFRVTAEMSVFRSPPREWDVGEDFICVKFHSCVQCPIPESKLNWSWEAAVGSAKPKGGPVSRAVPCCSTVEFSSSSLKSISALCQSHGRSGEPGTPSVPESEAPLLTSLDIQVSCPCTGHAYFGHRLTHKCYWWATFPLNLDLIGHAAQLLFSSPFLHWSVGHRLGECYISEAV